MNDRCRIGGRAPAGSLAPPWDAEWRDAKLDERQVAKEVWKLGNDPVLVAALETFECDGALWAQLGTRPVTAYERWDDPDMTSAVRAAFRRVPEWKAEQSRYRRGGGTGTWDELDEGDDGEAIKLFRHPDTGSVWAVVRVDVGVECEDDFEASLAAVFERTGGRAPRWRLRFTGELDRPIDAAHDIDGDREPELTGMQQVIRRAPGGGPYQQDSFAFPYYECNC